MNKYRFIANAFLSLAVWMCGARTLLAQQTPEGGVPVHMVVTVEPHHGSDVPVVNREDVMVYEGKDRDPVTEWIPAQGDHAALEFFILLDDGSEPILGFSWTIFESSSTHNRRPRRSGSRTCRTASPGSNRI